MLRPMFFALSLGLFAPTAWAQCNGVISGTVRDDQGDGLAGWVVQIEAVDLGGTIQTVTTDQNGDYAFTNLDVLPDMGPPQNPMPRPYFVTQLPPPDPQGEWTQTAPPTGVDFGGHVYVLGCNETLTGQDFEVAFNAFPPQAFVLSHSVEEHDLTGPAPVEVQAPDDTLWIEDWSFDLLPGCDVSGWTVGGDGNGRLIQDVSEQHPCVDNATCSWLWTDDLMPVPSGLHDVLMSPWASFVTTPAADATVLSYRVYPGNSFKGARIVHSWAVRGQTQEVLTPGGNDFVTVITPWKHLGWRSSSVWTWTTNILDLEPHLPAPAPFVSPIGAQVAFFVGDWGPNGLNCTTAGEDLTAGSGPFLDRIRIGRRLLSGPVFDVGIDSRSQAQDAFPTSGILGTCAFSSGEDLGACGANAAVVTGDAIHVDVRDVRGVGGLNVRLYGRIVEGPHIGKPPPVSIGTATTAVGDWFCVIPSNSGDIYQVDFDDDYFLGGDVLVYFWVATDADYLTPGTTGLTSEPSGLSNLTDVPTTVDEVQRLTGGLYEVSFLPKIDWDPDFLQAIQDDPGSGKITPFGDNTQANCILYVQMADSDRRSGDAHRTSMMYTLDRLGYRGKYDVYDVQGFGNTNNHLAGRATIQQAEGYSLLIQDVGRRRSSLVPNAGDQDSEKLDQAAWYQQWLAQTPTSRATLWMLGENLVEEEESNPLVTTELAVTLTNSGPASFGPEVLGQGSFMWSSGESSNFAQDQFFLAGLCDVEGNYDQLGAASASAVVTHAYAGGGGAIVMNSNSNPDWDTVTMAFPWHHIAESGSTAGLAANALAREILHKALPLECQVSLNDSGDPCDASIAFDFETGLQGWTELPPVDGTIDVDVTDGLSGQYLFAETFTGLTKLVAAGTLGPLNLDHEIRWAEYVPDHGVFSQSTSIQLVPTNLATRYQSLPVSPEPLNQWNGRTVRFDDESQWVRLNGTATLEEVLADHPTIIFDMLTTPFVAGLQARIDDVELWCRHTTDVGGDHTGPSYRTLLDQNFPNPFNPSTTIRYRVSSPRSVRLDIFDARGRLVRNLVRSKQAPGEYQVQWDGNDNSGRRVQSGAYFYQIVEGQRRESRKLVVLK